MPRQRYRQEIERILERDDARRRRVARVRRVTSGVRLPRFSVGAGSLMWAGLAFLIAAVMLRRFFLFFAAAGVLLLIAAYLMQFARPRTRARYEPRWRAQVVRYPDTWSNRVRRLFRGRR